MNVSSLLEQPSYHKALKPIGLLAAFAETLLLDLPERMKLFYAHQSRFARKVRAGCKAAGRRLNSFSFREGALIGHLN
jgi:hypothetical protein